MVHVPKILKVSASILKPAAETGAVFVQAHPIAAAFTVVAIVGVGLAIYYTKNSKNKKKEDELTHLSRGNMGHSKDESSYYYNPETKSINVDIPKSTATHQRKALRKRQVFQTASSVNESNPLLKQESMKSSSTFSKKVANEISGNNLNIDKGKVLQNDILNTSKELTGEEKVNQYIQNLSQTEFIECNEKSSDECNSIENLDENSINLSDGSQSYWIDNSFLDLNDFRSESSVGTLLPEQSNFCRACKENPVNTYTQPCNHRYMCGHCAIRIFRLFKRCKVCRARIEEIIVDTS